ncbi:tyrosine recombinase XerC [Oscillospiraceae bacterium CM]|nr:tyrosine recombinase XerC [Oscillospiraceae bacterium CM]
MDDRLTAPAVIRDFLTYHETIKGHSKKTADEYYLDLRTFFRFLKRHRRLVPKDTAFDDISIQDVDLAVVQSVALADIYDYLAYLARERTKASRGGTSKPGLSATTRARKIAALRSFFNFLSVKTKQLDKNPVADLDSPKTTKTLPRYLTLEESTRLLTSVTGANRSRDYCILTLFLNCGLRISELAGLNLGDVRPDSLRVLGKGSKERIVYLNDACCEALNSYLAVRMDIKPVDRRALFLSSRRNRVSTATVHHLVKTHLAAAGLDADKYSSHKLRHTAATLMLRNGVDVRTLQELLGHEHLNTTQIYTHVESDSLREAALRSPLASLKTPKNMVGSEKDE